MSDTDGTWIIPCIDCFKRIEAVRADKESCIKDNQKKDIIILDLYADNREWRDRSKNNLLKGGIVGFLAGILGTYLIVN